MIDFACCLEIFDDFRDGPEEVGVEAVPVGFGFEAGGDEVLADDVEVKSGREKSSEISRNQGSSTGKEDVLSSEKSQVSQDFA
jgi:hypothetical protein